MSILILNCGSSSLKYKVFNPENFNLLKSGKIERIGANKNHTQAISEVLNEIDNFDITGVGHRVVHGGNFFKDSVLIDQEVIAKINECTSLAPPS